MNFFKAIVIFLALGVGVAIGILIPFHSSDKCPKNETYSLLDPKAFCDEYIGTDVYSDLRKKIFETINTSTEKKDIDIAAFFFLDLQSKESIGIREILKFSPASLTKLPVAIGIYKLAEVHPEILLRTVVPQESDIVNDEKQNIKPLDSLQVGKSYTFESLIEHMLADSSNDALHLIVNNLSNEETMALENDAFNLGLVLPDQDMPNQNDAILSARLMTSLLRVLYTSSYLSPDHSNLILKALSDSTFHDGIQRGIPEGVRVAHKFGERSKEDGLQLHDCGIVYHSTRPYAICIMTRGQDFIKMEEIIGELSKITYQFVDEKVAKK